jgi:hypothetical protein
MNPMALNESELVKIVQMIKKPPSV